MLRKKFFPTALFCLLNPSFLFVPPLFPPPSSFCLQLSPLSFLLFPRFCNFSLNHNSVKCPVFSSLRRFLLIGHFSGSYFIVSVLEPQFADPPPSSKRSESRYVYCYLFVPCIPPPHFRLFLFSYHLLPVFLSF